MNHRPLALSLCIALLMVSSCDSGDVGSQEDEDYDYGTPTPTPDYDYTATFDYYYVTGPGVSGTSRTWRMLWTPGTYGTTTNKASAIGQLTPMLLLGLAVCQMWG